MNECFLKKKNSFSSLRSIGNLKHFLYQLTDWDSSNDFTNPQSHMFVKPTTISTKATIISVNNHDYRFSGFAGKR